MPSRQARTSRAQPEYVILMMDNFEQGSVSIALAGFDSTPDESAELFWDRFFVKLCRYAESKVYARHRWLFDAEDIASSAMYALVTGLKQGRFYNVTNRDQLWQMLAIIASRKAANAAKHHDREKRGGGKIRGDSWFRGDDVEQSLPVEDPAEFEATCKELLESLPDAIYREIALMRLAGFTNPEIGEKLGCSARTIDRKLIAIREIWSDMSESEF